MVASARVPYSLYHRIFLAVLDSRRKDEGREDEPRRRPINTGRQSSATHKVYAKFVKGTASTILGRGVFFSRYREADFAKSSTSTYIYM